MKLGQTFKHKRTGYIVKITKVEVSLGIREPLLVDNKWVEHNPEEVVYNVDLELRIMGIGNKFVRLYERVRTTTKPYNEDEITPLISRLLEVKLDSVASSGTA